MERDSLIVDVLRHLGVFHDDCDGQALLGEPWILKRFAFQASGNHQASVHILGHLVGRSSLIQRFDHLLTSQRNVHVHYTSRLIQAVHVILDEGPLPIVETDALPNAIPSMKPAS